jgi:hypothetical protein
MKKIRGVKPVGVIIHTYMEISQGNSLCSCLYLKQAKMSCFSFYLSPIKSENMRAGQVLSRVGSGNTSGRVEVLRKWVGEDEGEWLRR